MDHHPPVDVDGESWTLTVWSLREQDIKRVSTVSDGGRAIQEALRQPQGDRHHQREVWHLFSGAAHVQRHLDRVVKTDQERVSAIQ